MITHLLSFKAALPENEVKTKELKGLPWARGKYDEPL
jgi:hypothetical protein